MNNLGEETCICCGLGIPEGRQVCPACERLSFYKGQYIVCINGNRCQIGRIKRLCSDGAFVFYHGGDTASKTAYESMRPIENEYTISETILGNDFRNWKEPEVEV